MYNGVRQLAPGDVFAGYRIEELAGRGGMGLVYRARQERPERVVAVKVIMPDLAGDPDFRARFELEASLAAQIEHPNVIPVYGVGDEDGLLYIVMRFVESQDLGVLLRARERLHAPHAARMVAQIAAALDAAHARGLVHRDVKPANVLVTATEHLYLTDFGLTKRVADVGATGGMTATGGLVGTLDYIAPEQASGGAVDARGDVYALGCLLYQLLTGVVPFPRDQEVAKIFAHLTLPPPMPTSRVPDLPAALDEVVARAMAKQPGDRFQSAGELARAAADAAAAPAAAADAPAASTASARALEPATGGGHRRGAAAPARRAPDGTGSIPGRARRMAGLEDEDPPDTRRRAADAAADRAPGRDRGEDPGEDAGEDEAGVQVPLPVIGGVAPSTPFVGREAQLERLRRPWREAVEGQRRFALVAGEPGVGKTRLAARFAAEVHAAGATVLYGRCDEEPLLPYQPFVEAGRHYRRFGDWVSVGESGRDLQQLSRLMPEARAQGAVGGESFAKDPDVERYLLFEAVARLVRRATRRRPLLLILDDLHWADKPTLLLLRHMLRLTDPARLMVLGVFRDSEVDADHRLLDLVADMRFERRLERLTLEGLDERETDELVAARLEVAASPGFVRGLRTHTEGNPFFMEEALRSLVQAHAVEPGAPAPEEALECMGVPESVAEVILRRLSRVSPVTREALSVAAVIGREIDIKVPQALLGIAAERVIESMEEAMAAGLVGELAGVVDRFVFCHTLVREAIYHRLSTSRRLRLHLRVGEALEAHGATGPGELAHHFFLARELGGAAKAVRHAVRAGEEAAQALAYEEAASHYRRALEAFALDPEGDEAHRCDILLALGRVQWQAGESAARETYYEAAASARSRGAAAQLAGAALGLGERYWEAGAVDEQYQRLLREALDTLSTEDSRPRARLMARLAENLHFTARQQHGAQLSLDALAMARRLGEVDTLVTALMGRHVALLHIEHLDERLLLIEEVLRLAEGHRPLTAEAHHWRLFDLCELGNVTQAHHDHARLAALGRELRQPLLEHLALGWQAAFAHLAGDVEAAERLAGESLAFADRAQVGHARSSLASMLFTLRRQQGRLEELLPAIQSLEAGGSASLAWSAALALTHVETGAPELGRERYERLAGRDFTTIPRDWYWSLTAGLLAETCAGLGDADRAPGLYALLEPFAERFVQVIFTVSWGSVHRYLGLLAEVMGRPDLAEDHFEAALAANARRGALLMTAETQCAYGAFLLRRGGTTDRRRAAALGAQAAAVAAPRGLNGVRRRAEGLLAGGDAP